MVYCVARTTLMSVRRFRLAPRFGGVVGHRVRRAVTDGLEARRLDVGEVFQNVVLDRRCPPFGERQVGRWVPVASVFPSTLR